MVYTVKLKLQKDGTIIALVPDVQGALTEGDTVAEVLSEAVDAIIAALCGHMHLGHDVPKSSKPKNGQPVVTLPVRVSLKLGLYQAMKDAGMIRLGLTKRFGTSKKVAKRFGTSKKRVRKLLDLDYPSKIGEVENALAMLGKRFVVKVVATPRVEFGPPGKKRGGKKTGKK